MDAVIAAGGAISHHHGIGINRSRFMEPSLGKAALLLETLKNALDPTGDPQSREARAPVAIRRGCRLAAA